MTNEPKKTVEKKFCVVKLSNGSTVRGFVYLEPNQRLQDLLNDSRDFIPIEILSETPPHTKVVGRMVISKRFILTAEESSFNPHLL